MLISFGKKQRYHQRHVLIESLVYVLFVLLVVDFIHEAKYMIKNKHINKIWKVDIKEKYIVNHDQVRYIH